MGVKCCNMEKNEEPTVVKEQINYSSPKIIKSVNQQRKALINTVRYIKINDFKHTKEEKNNVKRMALNSDNNNLQNILSDEEKLKAYDRRSGPLICINKQE